MKMPKRLLVYVCDYENDGTPILAVAKNLEEIPEDSAGDSVGEYELVAESKMTITRQLILKKRA